jgi:prepilin-type N-terminal cleavage/methylation domain-containing protein
MQKRQGFTLIELMIVIAIIAIIAAIAIPGLLSSQRASNERNASASLKTLASAEADFRGNDRDGNKIQDFWTRDVSGLYGLCPTDTPEPIRLIEISVAGADSQPLGTASSPAPADEVDVRHFTLSTPKAGYWYVALEEDEAGTPYATSTEGVGPLGAQPWFHRDKFAFLAYPDTFAAGRTLFYINEGNTIFKRAAVGNVRPAGGAVPPGVALIAAGAAGASPLLSWPSDADLRRDYSKLD